MASIRNPRDSWTEVRGDKNVGDERMARSRDDPQETPPTGTGSTFQMSSDCCSLKSSLLTNQKVADFCVNERVRSRSQFVTH